MSKISRELNQLLVDQKRDARIVKRLTAEIASRRIERETVLARLSARSTYAKSL